MRGTAKPLLDGKIGRRTFIARLAQAGVASTAATKLATSLSAEPAPRSGSRPARVLHDKTGGELIAEFLIDWEIPYVFGLGGSEEVGFLDALVDRLSLQHVQGLHEGSVMSMADGYARVSGKTPIMNLHSVAGAGYALGPMVNAFKDRIPGRRHRGTAGQPGFVAPTPFSKRSTCFRVTAEGRPYLVDVEIERRFGGADSPWYDFFSVAKRRPRTPRSMW